MKRSSILIMILMMMAIQSVLAQQDSNLVQNGTFEQGNVGFKSDFRFLPHEAFLFVRHSNLCGYASSTPIIMGSYIITDSFSYQKNRLFYPVTIYYDSSGFLGRSDNLESSFPMEQTAVNPVEPSTGSFLAVNISKSGKQRIWYDSITIKPNTTYSFSCILANVSTLPQFSTDLGCGCFKNPEAWFSRNPGALKLCVNGKKVSKVLDLPHSNEWKSLSGMFTSGPDQTRIEISIEDINSPVSNNLVALDNVVFKEIQAGEYEKEFAKEKEERFPKLGDKGGVVRGYKREHVIETPPAKEEEPIAVITPPVKKEEAVVEIPPVKEEEPIAIITLPVKEEEPVVEVHPKTEPSVVPPKPKPPVVISPKAKPPITVPPKPKLLAVVPPRPKLTVVVPPKPKPSMVVKTKPVKKDTASQIMGVSADFKKDISIDEIEVDQKLQLSHIYFERAKYNLLETSLPELNDLAAFMKKHPTIRIRLEGHTDNQGDHKLNVELSENRVKEVKKYLVEQGIDDNRIEWVGHGGQRPMNSNGNESLRQKNRRVEVVIISK